jgi:hypothetical protein
LRTRCTGRTSWTDWTSAPSTSTTSKGRPDRLTGVRIRKIGKQRHLCL